MLAPWPHHPVLIPFPDTHWFPVPLTLPPTPVLISMVWFVWGVKSKNKEKESRFSFKATLAPTDAQAPR